MSCLTDHGGHSYYIDTFMELQIRWDTNKWDVIIVSSIESYFSAFSHTCLITSIVRSHLTGNLGCLEQQ